MISSIKEYPCDISEQELDTLIEYIENTNLSSHPLAAKTDNNFLDHELFFYLVLVVKLVYIFSLEFLLVSHLISFLVLVYLLVCSRIVLT